MTTEAAEVIFRHGIEMAITELCEDDARKMIARIVERPAEFVDYVQAQIDDDPWSHDPDQRVGGG